MKYKKIYEFLVWDNCNNNCRFCFQRKDPRLFNLEKRKEILNEVLNFIDSDKFEKNNHILICGGEIFDKSSDFETLDIFFKEIIDRMNKDIIDLLYINTNLIYSDLTSLKNLLDLIEENNLFSRLKFTTSYDLEGRFKTNTSKELMLNNLKWIKENYPDCNIVTNTILTKQVCEAILDNTYPVKDFMKEYQCWVNLIPYIIYDETLAPKRELLFKTLRKVGNDCQGYLEEYIPNITIKQEKLLYIYKNNNFEFCSCELDKCGHSINFKRYSEKGSCFCCDLIKMFKGE